MNKSDLKNGMFVEYKDGTSRVYVDGGLWTENGKAASSEDIKDDLKSSISSEFDINKIFYCGKLIWEREKEIEIDWSKVPVGTKVLVSDNENNWYEHLFIDYEINLKDEIINFKAIGIISKQIHNWKYCKLAEEPKEEVTSDDIGKEMKSYCKKHNKSCDRICEICTVRYILDNYNLTRKVPKIENDKCSKCGTKVVYNDNEYETSLKHATCLKCGTSWTIGK